MTQQTPAEKKPPRLRKGSACPTCTIGRLLPIAYGLLTSEGAKRVKGGQIFSGGCLVNHVFDPKLGVISADPELACPQCKGKFWRGGQPTILRGGTPLQPEGGARMIPESDIQYFNEMFDKMIAQYRIRQLLTRAPLGRRWQCNFSPRLISCSLVDLQPGEADPAAPPSDPLELFPRDKRPFLRLIDPKIAAPGERWTHYFIEMFDAVLELRGVKIKARRAVRKHAGEDASTYLVRILNRLKTTRAASIPFVPIDDPALQRKEDQ